MKPITLLILTIMTTMTVAQNEDNRVYELVVYKIKTDYAHNYDDVLSEARTYILKFPGIIEHQTFRASENQHLFMDLVKWNSLDEALSAARQLETIKELAPFMAAFEEIKFMDHFELFSQSHENPVNPLDDEYYYAAESSVQLIVVKNYQYLSLSGVSSPEDEQFLGAIGAIQAVAHTIKQSHSEGFDIAPLEAQWWAEGELKFDQTPRNEWHWNLLIPVPDYIHTSDMETAIQRVSKNTGMSLASEVQLTRLNEDKSLQVLHVGSYDNEASSIEKMFKYAKDNGLQIEGKHHEIYLSDPAKVKVEELRTILRYPVK